MQTMFGRFHLPMSRHIIIIEQEPYVVYPIVRESDELMIVFDSIDEARECADNSIMCQSYPYKIIDLDKTYYQT